MSVAIFKNHTGKQGILTNEETEDEFIRKFSDVAARLLVKNVCAKTAQEVTDFIEADPKSDNGPIYLMHELMTHAVEICIKYRGYKSSVIERRELFSGTNFPNWDELKQVEFRRTAFDDQQLLIGDDNKPE